MSSFEKITLDLKEEQMLAELIAKNLSLSYAARQKNISPNTQAKLNTVEFGNEPLSRDSQTKIAKRPHLQISGNRVYNLMQIKYLLQNILNTRLLNAGSSKEEQGVETIIWHRGLNWLKDPLHIKEILAHLQKNSIDKVLIPIVAEETDNLLALLCINFSKKMFFYFNPCAAEIWEDELKGIQNLQVDSNDEYENYELFYSAIHYGEPRDPLVPILIIEAARHLLDSEGNNIFPVDFNLMAAMEQHRKDLMAMHLWDDENQAFLEQEKLHKRSLSFGLSQQKNIRKITAENDARETKVINPLRTKSRKLDQENQAIAGSLKQELQSPAIKQSPSGMTTTIKNKVSFKTQGMLNEKDLIMIFLHSLDHLYQANPQVPKTQPEIEYKIGYDWLEPDKFLNFLLEVEKDKMTIVVFESGKSHSCLCLIKNKMYHSNSDANAKEVIEKIKASLAVCKQCGVNYDFSICEKPYSSGFEWVQTEAPKLFVPGGFFASDLNLSEVIKNLGKLFSDMNPTSANDAPIEEVKNNTPEK